MGDAVDGLLNEIIALIPNIAGRRLIESGNQIKAGGFSGTVRTNKSKNVPFLQLKGNGIDRNQSTKADGRIL